MADSKQDERKQPAVWTVRIVAGEGAGRKTTVRADSVMDAILQAGPKLAEGKRSRPLRGSDETWKVH